MKIGRIVHQQIVQLRWHFLACLGLLMALPLEEAFLSLKDGHAFYATGISLGIPIVVAPLLAGLIACANVQADLDESRYIFWRSKPIGVKFFVAIKYLVGLIIAFVVIASPIAFTLISCMIQNERIERDFTSFIVNFQLVSVLAYSTCFFCNVLIRKTARAWLIGMAMTVFLLLVPFILPLNFKDSRDIIFAASIICLSVALGPSLIAFVASLFAVSRNWYLKTNLKGLLWVGAALIFLLMLLFTRQVANIKVLDEKEVYNACRHCIKRINGKLLLDTQLAQPLKSSPEKQTFENVYINVEKNQIQFETINDTILRYRRAMFAPEPPDENAAGDPIFKINKGDLYVVSMYISSRRDKPGRSQMVHDNVYLRSYSISSPKSELVSKIDLSEFVENPRSWPDVVMRQIGDKIVAIVNRSCAVVEFDSNGQLKVLEKKLKKLAIGPIYQDRQFSIPIVTLETIALKDRIRLSLDLATVPMSYYLKDLSQRVDEYNGRYYFVVVSESGIQRYEVIRWDDKFIICKPKGTRPFTILERMVGDTWMYKEQYFVKDGILYIYGNKSLVVFNIRSARIRKLGYYARPKKIEDIEVLDDGNILLLLSDYYIRLPHPENQELQGYLELLKNPE